MTELCLSVAGDDLPGPKLRQPVRCLFIVRQTRHCGVSHQNVHSTWQSSLHEERPVQEGWCDWVVIVKEQLSKFRVAVQKVNSAPQISLFLFGRKFVKLCVVSRFWHACNKIEKLLFALVQVIHEGSKLFLVEVTILALLYEITGCDLILEISESVRHFLEPVFLRYVICSEHSYFILRLHFLT